MLGLAALLAAAVSAQGPSGLNTTTEGEGTLRVGLSNRALQRATVVLSGGGKSEITLYGEKAIRLTGTWRDTGRGRIAIDVREASSDNLRGSGRVLLDNRFRLHRVELSGVNWSASYESKGIGPWVDAKPDDRPQSFNGTANGNGTHSQGSTRRDLRRVSVLIRTNGDTEINFTGDQNFAYAGTVTRRDGNSVRVSLDKGPNADTSGTATISFKDGKLFRVELDGRDVRGWFEARLTAGDSGGVKPPIEIPGTVINETQRGSGSFRQGTTRRDLDRATVNLKRNGEAEIKVMAAERTYTLVGTWTERGSAGWNVEITSGLGSGQTRGSGRIDRARNGGFDSITLTGRDGREDRFEIDFKVGSGGTTPPPVGTANWIPFEGTDRGEGTIRLNGEVNDTLESATVTIRRDGTFSVRMLGDRSWTFSGTYRRLNANQADLKVDRGRAEVNGTGLIGFTNDGKLRALEMDIQTPSGQRYVVKFTARR